MQNSNSSAEYDFHDCAGNAAGTFTWALFSFLSFAFGFPASVFILWEMFRTHRGGAPLTPNDLFIVNLSAMDALFLLVIPAGLMNHFSWKAWFIEAMWNTFYSLSTCGRPLLMACACLDCYVAVVHPIVYHQRKSLRPRVAVVAVVWALTLASGVAHSLLWWLYITFYPMLIFLIAFLIIVMSDILILWSLLKSDRSRGSIHPQKQRAVQTLVSSLGMAVMAYFTPILCFTVGKILIQDTAVFSCTVAIPVIITSTLGSSVMPFFSLYNLGKLECVRPTICRLQVPPGH